MSANEFSHPATCDEAIAKLFNCEPLPENKVE